MPKGKNLLKKVLSPKVTSSEDPTKAEWDLILRIIEIAVAFFAVLYAGGQLKEMTIQSQLAQQAIEASTIQLEQNSKQLLFSTEALKNQQRLTGMQMIQSLDKELALNPEKQELLKQIKKNDKNVFSIFDVDGKIKPQVAIFLDFFVQLAWVKGQPYFADGEQHIDNDFRVFFKNYLSPLCLNDEVKEYEKKESGYQTICKMWELE